MWTHSLLLSTPTHGTCLLVIQCAAHTLYMLIQAGWTPYDVTSIAGCDPAHISLGGRQISLCATPIVPFSCRWVWDFYFSLFPRNSAHFCVYEVSTSCPIDVFYSISHPLFHLFYLFYRIVLGCFWVVYIPIPHPEDHFYCGATIGELSWFLCFTPPLWLPYKFSMFSLHCWIEFVNQWVLACLLDTIYVF